LARPHRIGHIRSCPALPRRAAGVWSGFWTSLPRPADRPDLAAVAAAAEEAVGAVALQAGDERPGGHLQPLQQLAGLRIDSPHVAGLALPGAVPQLAVDPGDAGDETVGGQGAQDGPGLRVDLVDLALAVLADPQRPLRPGHAGIAAAARGG